MIAHLQIPKEEFDELALVAGQACNTPIAIITMSDGSHESFKGNVGLEMPSIPNDWEFTFHTRLQKDVLVVSDTTMDERFCGSPQVKGAPFIKFFAGAPILSPEGAAIGTLCIFDIRSRSLDSEQVQSLKALTNQIQKLINLRLQLFEMNALNEKLNLSQTAIDNLDEGIITKNAAGEILNFNPAALKFWVSLPTK